jgi:PIN domain nuclease of toxin-antitoxin system
MRLLLDTHAFLWFITNDPQLSAVARSHISDPNHEILVSPASYCHFLRGTKIRSTA